MLVIAVHELDPVLKVVFHLREMVLKDLIRIGQRTVPSQGDPVSEIYAEERGLDPYGRPEYMVCRFPLS